MGTRKERRSAHARRLLAEKAQRKRLQQEEKQRLKQRKKAERESQQLYTVRCALCLRCFSPALATHTHPILKAKALCSCQKLAVHSRIAALSVWVDDLQYVALARVIFSYSALSLQTTVRHVDILHRLQNYDVGPFPKLGRTYCQVESKYIELRNRLEGAINERRTIASED